MIITGLIILFGMFASFASAYEPVCDGAKADMRIIVVDDGGCPVSNADVVVKFYSSPEKVVPKQYQSDNNGYCHATGYTYGEVYLAAVKSGYYKTFAPAVFRTSDYEAVVKSHLWSSQPVTNQLVLRRKKNPVKPVLRGGRYIGLNYPRTSGKFGFDLSCFDWCPPFGEGKRDDLQIEREFWRSPDDWYKVFEKVTITATNNLDGLAIVDKKNDSHFRFPYSADECGNFTRCILFEYDRRSGKVTSDIKINDNQCVVFKVRTKTDDSGKILSARYGVLDWLQPFMTFNCLVLFNPNENDASLEFTEQ